MEFFIVGLIILVCILLVLVVLAQNSKGGGLTAGMGGASQIMGTRRTTDITEKATWVLATALFVFCFTMNVISASNRADNTPPTNGGNDIENTTSGGATNDATSAPDSAGGN